MTKVRRGQCGTCHWFEPNPPEMQKIKDRLLGYCFVNPPQATMTTAEIPGSRLSQQGAQFAQVPAGMRPMTVDIGRCYWWRPSGITPPFDDLVRPGLKESDADTEGLPQ